jgi:hypothetical protein
MTDNNVESQQGKSSVSETSWKQVLSSSEKTRIEWHQDRLVLELAVGAIFKDIDSELYYNSISMILSVRLQP